MHEVVCYATCSRNVAHATLLTQPFHATLLTQPFHATLLTQRCLPNLLRFVAYLLFPQIPEVTLCHKSSHPLKSRRLNNTEVNSNKMPKSWKSRRRSAEQRVGAAGHRSDGGIVGEQCRGLTTHALDHFPSINAGWHVAKISVMAPICNAK